MNIEAILAAGYRKFHDTNKAQQLGDWYHGSYQKRITDQYGVRYFITINHSIIPHPLLGKLRIAGPEVTEMFSVENQFKRDGIVFNVTMLHHDETLEQVEAFFADIWDKLRLDYYEEFA